MERGAVVSWTAEVGAAFWLEGGLSLLPASPARAPAAPSQGTWEKYSRGE